MEGSPYQPDDLVVVAEVVDKDVCDLSEFVGRTGVVVHLEYECGCGQHYPDDPMVGVTFDDGQLVEFWKEELIVPGAKKVLEGEVDRARS